MDGIHDPEGFPGPWARLLNLGRVPAVDELPQARTIGQSRASGRLDVTLHPGHRGPVDAVDHLGCHPFGQQEPPVEDERVVMMPVVGDLIVWPVPLGVPLVVSAPSVGDPLDHHWTTARSTVRDDVSHDGGHGRDIVAVDSVMVDAVGDTSLGETGRVLIGRRREFPHSRCSRRRTRPEGPTPRPG